MDRDLQARQEARVLARDAEQAAARLARMTQEQLDAIVEAVAVAFAQEAQSLAEMAVAETGFGNVADKTTKNRFASEQVARAIRGKRYVGLLREKETESIWEIGVPVGVIAAIVPSTNPTSTVCYKALIALKAGNAIVFSPHPKAIGCTRRAVEILEAAARKAGAPAGSLGCLSVSSMAGCQELMAAPQVRLILATGGPGMVKAAYSSGKPAIGVGAGNGPAYLHKSADLPRAIRCIVSSKTFDNGTVCASEQSIVVEREMEAAVVAEGKRQGLYFMQEAEADALAELLFQPGGALNPETVGRTAEVLAKTAGFSVPEGTKILVAREKTGQAQWPFAMEKLCPVLAFYVLEDETAVEKRCVEILNREGRGHTFVIHARDEAVIRRFAHAIPVSRFLVNAPAAQGGIGAATGLFPALTLGCGAVGGSSSSNNISPEELTNIRRVAWGLPDAETDRPGRKATPEEDSDALVELLTRKIMERLEEREQRGT